MDLEYQRRLMEADMGRLEKRIAEAKSNIQLDYVDRTLFARMYGSGGHTEPYLAKIQPARYPVGPWRIGFIDPKVESGKRLTIPDRDPRFWPYSLDAGLAGGFHVAFAGIYRVFVCRPFTIEYFFYHTEARWEPKVYDLPRVVSELDRELKKAEHFSKWWNEHYLRIV
jgi:hypothetical protein